MNPTTHFTRPYLLGFDRFEQALDRIARNSGDGYPPYNVVRLDENRLRIVLAVAGFSEEDLSVHVEGDQLVIRGERVEKEDLVYLYRGIASRRFQRSFILAEGMEVVLATLEKGLLSIDLVRPPAEERVCTIEIKGEDPKRARKSRKGIGEKETAFDDVTRGQPSVSITRIDHA